MSDLQCKDIDTDSFLDTCKHISHERFGNDFGASSWAVAEALGIPLKLAIAKADKLIRKGKLDGCSCGCRGDWYPTVDGEPT